MKGNGQKGELGYFQDTEWMDDAQLGVDSRKLTLFSLGTIQMLWFGRIWGMVLPSGTKSP